MTCLNTNYALPYDTQLPMLERLDVCPTLLSLGPNQVPTVDFHMVLCRNHATIFILTLLLHAAMLEERSHIMQRPVSLFLSTFVQPNKFPKIHTKLQAVAKYTGKAQDSKISFDSLYETARGKTRIADWIKNAVWMQTNFEVCNDVVYAHGFVSS